GRLFDGVASLLGVRDRVSVEAQAAIELEWLARSSRAQGSYPVEVSPDGEIRIAPIVSAILGEVRKGIGIPDIARRFHRTLADAVRKVCLLVRERSAVHRVVLSGGVFMNEILLVETLEGLRRDGFAVYRHRRVPPNDGGLALGQLAVAAAGGGS